MNIESPRSLNSVRLLLADDHTLFCDALSTYILRAEPTIEIVSVTDLHEVQNQLKGGPSFQMAMIDWHMPGVIGIDDFKNLVTQYPETRFVLMSGVIDQQKARQAIDVGLWGYFPKTLSGRTLVDGVRRVLSGERFVPNDLAGQDLMPSYKGEKLFFKPNAKAIEERAEALLAELTVREREVLMYLCEGLTNAELADRMNIKEVTVKLHLRNAFDKIGARNRTDAVVKCRQLGLLNHE